MYRILDRQIPGRYFADGAVFCNKKAVRDQLIAFHSNDMEKTDVKTLQKMTLQEILDFGDWTIEKVKE